MDIKYRTINEGVEIKQFGKFEGWNTHNLDFIFMPDFWDVVEALDSMGETDEADAFLLALVCMACTGNEAETNYYLNGHPKAFFAFTSKIRIVESNFKKRDERIDYRKNKNGSY